MAKKPVYYSQTDIKWKNLMYSSVGDKSQTIGLSGCGPTAAAMVVSTLTDQKKTPVDIAEFSVKHGHRTKNNGTSFSLFADVGDEFGFDVIYTWNFETALQAIKDGYLVIGRAQKGLWTRGGHFILWYGLDGNYVLINDPNSTAADKSRAPLATLKAQVTPFFICKSKGAIAIEEKASNLIDLLSRKISISDKPALKKELIERYNSSMWWTISRLISEYPDKKPSGKTAFEKAASILPLSNPNALKQELTKYENSSMWWVIQKLLAAR